MDRFLVKRDIEPGAKFRVTPRFSQKLEPSLIRQQAIAAWNFLGESFKAGPKVKVAAFDLDNTVVKTKSGRTFPVTAEDWTFLTKDTLARMQALTDSGYMLVIFSNQKGTTARLDQKSLPKLSGRVYQVAQRINRHLYVFCSLKCADPKEPYRKPKSGMWDVFVEELAERGLVPDLGQSFFVGDAAGRPGDHSDADILFAQNAGLVFYTPEQWETKE